MTDIAPYQPGMMAAAAIELDPDGKAGNRLRRKLERTVERTHLAIAVDTLAFILADALATAPQSVRMAVAEDVFNAIRHHVRQSLD